MGKITEGNFYGRARHTEMEINSRDPIGKVPAGFSAMTSHHKTELDRGGVKNKDGSISTVRTIIVTIDGKETIIPTVWDGKILSTDEAIKRAMDSGLEWPQFDSVEEAEKADQSWHRAMGLTH